MEWGNFENIIWILIVPIFIAASFYIYRWKISAREKFADKELIEKLIPLKSGKKFWTSVVLLSLGLLFSVIALMDPLYGEENVKIKREGIDIVYALDLSNSMYSEDVAPNRLEKAKKLILESTQRLAGDRIGLMIFALDAYSISPLTHDYNSIQAYINIASPELITHQGTNFSAIIKRAIEVFDDAPTTSKLLVILSDGEDNEKSLKEAIQLAKENEINIITIGIGTQTGAPIPYQSEFFNGFKTDSQGNVVISKLNESSLQALAESVGGVYIYADQNQKTIDQLHSHLNNLQKSISDEDFRQSKKHVFQWFLAIAILFIFIDTLTSEHKLFNNKK